MTGRSAGKVAHSFAFSANEWCSLMPAPTRAEGAPFLAFCGRLGLGRRQQKTDAGGTVHSFVFDGNQPYTEFTPGFTRQAGGFYTYANGTTYFNRADNLTMPRLSTDYNGTVQRTEGVLMGPFGDNFTETLSTLDFTGFAGGFWDSENNGEHFGAREYQNTHGSWLSPDPAGMAAVDITNPQSWNRYAYALNNPVTFVDPTGLECAWDDGSYDSADDPQTGSSASCGTAGGVWIEPSFFSTMGLSDWSSDPNFSVQQLYNAVDWGENPTATVYSTPTDLSGDSSRANNSTWQWIKNTARKIGSYIPTPCGGGVYNYGGLQVSNGVSNVAVSQIRVADSREGYLQGPFGEFGYGEGIVGGVGQAQFNNGNETFLFAGAGGDLSVVGANLSAFGTSTGSFGCNLEAEIGPFKGGVGIYQNFDSLTSCLDHGGH